MLLLERFHSLTELEDETSRREELFKISKELGFDNVLMAVVDKSKESLEPAFLCSNYPKNWLKTYFQEQMAYVDPVVTHSRKQTSPLIWSPQIFVSNKQKELYEEAQGYGLHTGVTLPIHNSNNQLGILSFVNDRKFENNSTKKYLTAYLPTLVLLRDFLFDRGIKFSLPNKVKNYS